MVRPVSVAALVALGLILPSPASAAQELSTTDRLDDRRYVTTGPRAYDVGTEAGRYPAMGFHTRGEMGGIWSPPIKLVDGIWFGIDEKWIGPATRFTSGYGHVRMRLPGRGGLSVERTDFVPGEERGVTEGRSGVLRSNPVERDQDEAPSHAARRSSQCTVTTRRRKPSTTTLNPSAKSPPNRVASSAADSVKSWSRPYTRGRVLTTASTHRRRMPRSSRRWSACWE